MGEMIYVMALSAALRHLSQRARLKPSPPRCGTSPRGGGLSPLRRVAAPLPKGEAIL